MKGANMLRRLSGHGRPHPRVRDGAGLSGAFRACPLQTPCPSTLRGMTQSGATGQGLPDAGDGGHLVRGGRRTTAPHPTSEQKAALG